MGFGFLNWQSAVAAVVLYMEASRRRSLQKSKEMPAESCEKGKGHGLQVEVKQSAEEPAHKEHMPRRKEQLPMQKPLKVMVVSPMRDPHRGPQAVGTPVASHLQSPSKALRMKLFGTPKSAPSSSSGSSFGWPGHQGDGISTPRVISAGQEAAIPDSPAIPGDLDRMNLTVSFGRSTIYRYPESPGQAGWMPRRDASSYFSTPVRMQRTFVTDFRELSSPETSASVSREERASRIDGDDSLPRFTLERNRQQGQQRSPPESPVTTNDGAHIASPQQLTPYHGRSFRPSLLGIGAIVRESVQSTEREYPCRALRKFARALRSLRVAGATFDDTVGLTSVFMSTGQAMVEVDANRPRDAAPGEACGNSTGGSGSLGKENCNE